MQALRAAQGRGVWRACPDWQLASSTRRHRLAAFGDVLARLPSSAARAGTGPSQTRRARRRRGGDTEGAGEAGGPHGSRQVAQREVGRLQPQERELERREERGEFRGSGGAHQVGLTEEVIAVKVELCHLVERAEGKMEQKAYK